MFMTRTCDAQGGTGRDDFRCVRTPDRRVRCTVTPSAYSKPRLAGIQVAPQCAAGLIRGGADAVRRHVVRFAHLVRRSVMWAYAGWFFVLFLPFVLRSCPRLKASSLKASNLKSI